MKGFILLTDSYDNARICVPLSSIFEVSEEAESKAYVVLSFNSNGIRLRRIGFTPVESFDEVIKKIEEAGR